MNEKGKEYMVIEGFEAEGRRFILSILEVNAPTVTYWRADIIGVDSSDRWEFGFESPTDAIEWCATARETLQNGQVIA